MVTGGDCWSFGFGDWLDFFVLLLLASDLTLAGGSNGSVDQGGAPVGSSSRLSSLKINLTFACKSSLAAVGFLPFGGVSWTNVFLKLTGVQSDSGPCFLFWLLGVP